MVFDASQLAGVANVALRALHHEVVRQASSTLATTATPTNPTASIPSEDTVDAAPTAQPSSTNPNQNPNTGGSSSPLLFFVALGFGVVFTNLW